MGAFDTNLGAILLGAFINTYLYGVSSFQCLSYYNTNFGDPVKIKLLVASLFCVDTAHSISVIYMTWVYLIEHMDDPAYALTCVWPLPFSAIVVSLTAYVVQNFLALRAHRLIGIDWLLGVFFFISTGTMLLGLVLGVKVMKMNLLPEILTLKPPLTAWLSLEVALDTSLSTTLFIFLQKSRTGFRRSDAIVNRLTRSAVQSGAFTSLFAILALVSFLALPTTLFYATFGMPIGRVYSCTMMDTLLCRKDLRFIMNNPVGSKQGPSSLPSIFGKGDWFEMQVRKDEHEEAPFQEEIVGSSLERFESLGKASV